MTTEPTPEKIEQLRGILRERMIAARKAGYEIVRSPRVINAYVGKRGDGTLCCCALGATALLSTAETTVPELVQIIRTALDVGSGFPISDIARGFDGRADEGTPLNRLGNDLALEFVGPLP